MEEIYCERCGEKLDRSTAVELELNTATSLYSDPKKTAVPPKNSQGLFFFGSACAKTVLKAGGLNRPIRRRK